MEKGSLHANGSSRTPIRSKRPEHGRGKGDGLEEGVGHGTSRRQRPDMRQAAAAGIESSSSGSTRRTEHGDGGRVAHPRTRWKKNPSSDTMLGKYATCILLYLIIKAIRFLPVQLFLDRFTLPQILILPTVATYWFVSY